MCQLIRVQDVSAAAQTSRIYSQRNQGLGSELALYVYTLRVLTRSRNSACDLERVSHCENRRRIALAIEL